MVKIVYETPCKHFKSLLVEVPASLLNLAVYGAFSYDGGEKLSASTKAVCVFLVDDLQQQAFLAQAAKFPQFVQVDAVTKAANLSQTYSSFNDLMAAPTTAPVVVVVK